MKRLLAFLILLFLVPCLTGCALVSTTSQALVGAVRRAVDNLRLYTNLPFFYDYNLEIINTGPYDLEVAVSGEAVRFFDRRQGTGFDTLQPTQTGRIPFQNPSAAAAQATVSIKAWDSKGRLVGARSAIVLIANNYSQARTWIVTEETFKETSLLYLGY